MVSNLFPYPGGACRAYLQRERSDTMTPIEILITNGPHLVLLNANKYNLSRVIIANDGDKYRLNVFSKWYTYHDQNYDTIDEAKESFLFEFRHWAKPHDVEPNWREMTLPIAPGKFREISGGNHRAHLQLERSEPRGKGEKESTNYK
ncbi:MAG: hypothetical protein GY765_16285 [bacterium]|nr:hypothetical protein [bacterium]